MPPPRRLAVRVAIVVALGLAAAGCTSHRHDASAAGATPPSSGPPGTPQASTPAGTAVAVTSGAASAPAGGPTASPSRSAGVPVASPQNLVVDDALRAKLLAAGAKLNGLAPSDYNGLVHGLTYYAYDPVTLTYWAGARLDPLSYQAQVASQDDGAYLLFSRPKSGSWTAIPVGMAGGPEGGPCPTALPAAVVKVWGWPPGTCHPSGY
jgi:hypothetical protein